MNIQDKKEITEQLKICVMREIEGSKKRMQETQIAINEAPSPMESHSDTTRFQFQKIQAEEQRNFETLETLSNFLKSKEYPATHTVTPGSLVGIEEDGKEEGFFIVPIAAANIHISFGEMKIRLISATSPIGISLMYKTKGETIALNLPKRRRIFKITEIL